MSPTLSRRQHDVMFRLVQGKTHHVIALELGISRGAVSVYVKRARRRMFCAHQTLLDLADHLESMSPEHWLRNCPPLLAGAALNAMQHRRQAAQHAREARLVRSSSRESSRYHYRPPRISNRGLRLQARAYTRRHEVERKQGKKELRETVMHTESPMHNRRGVALPYIQGGR
jgi:hypothetical protein